MVNVKDIFFHCHMKISLQSLWTLICYKSNNRSLEPVAGAWRKLRGSWPKDQNESCPKLLVSNWNWKIENFSLLIIYLSINKSLISTGLFFVFSFPNQFFSGLSVSVVLNRVLDILSLNRNQFGWLFMFEKNFVF